MNMFEVLKVILVFNKLIEKVVKDGKVTYQEIVNLLDSFGKEFNLSDKVILNRETLEKLHLEDLISTYIKKG